MSRHQQSKPSRAKWSIAEESGRPGTCRSKVGCEAIEEPCTNKIVPRVLAGSPADFSNRNSFTLPFLVVQCSVPFTDVAISFIVHLSLRHSILILAALITLSQRLTSSCM